MITLQIGADRRILHPQQAVRLACGLAAASLALLAPACDKVPLLAPGESTITLSATNLVLPVNGSTEVTAVVLEKPGTPVQNGTTVYFTTTLGTVEPSEATTHDGRVTVRYSAGTQSGEAIIAASSGATKTTAGGAASAGTGVSLTIKVGSAAAGSVVLGTSSATVPAAGGTILVTAIVLDDAGNPLPGVPVSFSSTAGALGAAIVVSVANGEATTTLRTDRETTVTATAGAKSASATIKVISAPAVALSVSTASPAAGQTVSFSVTVNVGANGAALRAVSLAFGDGDTANLGTPTGAVSVSHAYGNSGSYTVTATAIDITGQLASASTVVVVGPAPTLAVNLRAASYQAGRRRAGPLHRGCHGQRGNVAAANRALRVELRRHDSGAEDEREPDLPCLHAPRHEGRAGQGRRGRRHDGERSD